MERKRTRLSFLCDEENQDRRISPRRISQRSRKQVKYSDDDVSNKEEEDGEQPGPSTQITKELNAQQQKSLLTVTCGNKTGILHVEKLQKRVKCIECDNHWFSPSAFENFGGKGAHKKWRMSIFYDTKPVKFWFEQNKVGPLNDTSGSSAEESEVQSTEGTEEHDVKDENWIPAGASNVADSGVDTCREDQMDVSEMEDEDVPRVADQIQETELQREVKVIIKRLPQFQANKAHPDTSAGDASNGEEDNGLDEVADTKTVLSQMAYPVAIRDDLEERDSDEDSAAEPKAIKEERTYDDSASTALGGLVIFEITNGDISSHDTAESKEMQPEGSVPHVSIAPDITLSFDEEEAPPTTFDLDTMDLDQLKREKVKMQIKVLKLQEEYYTLRVKQLKN